MTDRASVASVASVASGASGDRVWHSAALDSPGWRLVLFGAALAAAVAIGMAVGEVVGPIGTGPAHPPGSEHPMTE